MPKAHVIRNQMVLADGDDTTQRFPLDEAHRLKACTLVTDHNEPPIRCSLELKVGNNFHKLARGWLRGHGTGSIRGGLMWEGDLLIPPRHATLLPWHEQHGGLNYPDPHHVDGVTGS